jgi:hypothetical protein
MTFIKQSNLDFRSQLNAAGRLRTSNQRSQNAYLQLNGKDTVRFDEETSDGGETNVYGL